MHCPDGIRRVFLTGAIEGLWKRDLLPNIRKGLCASVYTQVSDIEDETNGLLTYDREEVKVDAGRIAQLNRQVRDAFEEAVHGGGSSYGSRSGKEKSGTGGLL